MRIYKTIGAIAAAFLLLSTLLGSFGADKAEAASSRVAVIKELKGSVKVKKAGGSKLFTAFARMSLNEGDTLTTDGKGSAVLLFSNGSADDDRMTVSANTTITFSKLTSRGGTTTKVSMFNGSAWVDVKSIQNENDEFTLQTPTAIMGVRGTHLLVSVDPLTNTTHLTVAAGVVRTETNGSGNQREQDVYPTQKALITDSDDEASGEILIAPVDLALLMEQSDSSIVTAILQSAADITEENARYAEQYAEQGLPPQLGDAQDELSRFKTNTENLLGAIANQAVKSGLLTQERLDQIVREVQTQSGVKVDLTKSELSLTEQQKQQQEEQRRKEEERKKKAEDQRTPEGEPEKKLKEDKSNQKQDNAKADEEKKRKQLEAYEKQLSEAEKRRFAEEKANREKEQTEAQAAALPSSPTPDPTPSTTDQTPDPTPSPTLSNVSSLDALNVFGTGIYGFNSAVTSYTLQVSNFIASVPVSAIAAANSNATMTLNGSAITSGEEVNVTLNPAGSDTVIPIVVTAENGVNTTEYTLTVHREANLVEESHVTLPGGAIFDPQIPHYELGSVSNAVSSISMKFGKPNGYFDVSVTNNGATVTTVSAGTSFDVPLVEGDNGIAISLVPIVNPDNQAVTMMQLYTFHIQRDEGPTLSSVSSLDALNIFGTGIYGFDSAVTSYTLQVSNLIDSVPVSASIAANSNATLTLNGSATASGEEVNVTLNPAGSDTVIPIVVTAENGVDTTEYTLTVHREANLAEAADVSLPGDVAFDPQATVYELDSVSNAVSSISMKFGKPNESFKVSVTNNGATVTTASAGTSFDVPLVEGDNEIAISLVPIVDPDNQAVTMPQSYTFYIQRAAAPEEPEQWGFEFAQLTNTNPEWITTPSLTGLNQIDSWNWFASLKGNAVNKVVSLWFENTGVSTRAFTFNNEYVEPSGGKYNVTLKAGWNLGSMNVTFDNSQYATYVISIWVGNEAPGTFELDSIGAVDQQTITVDTGVDAINPQLWYAQATGMSDVDITPVLANQNHRVTKVALENGQDAANVNGNGTYRIPYNGTATTALIYVLQETTRHSYVFKLLISPASIDVDLAGITATPRTFGGDQTAIIFDEYLDSQYQFDVGLTRDEPYGLVPYTIKVKPQRKLEQQVVKIKVLAYEQELGKEQDAYVSVDIGSKLTTQATIQVTSESGRTGEYVLNFTRPLSGWTGLHSFRVYINEGECSPEYWKAGCPLIDTSSFQKDGTKVLTILPFNVEEFRIQAPTTDWRTTVVITIDGVPMTTGVDAVQLDPSKNSFMVQVHIISEDGQSTADYYFELVRSAQQGTA